LSFDYLHGFYFAWEISTNKNILDIELCNQQMKVAAKKMNGADKERSRVN
jgi:hypothetical protein